MTTYAHNEQNFNAVERILHYTRLPSEGAATTHNDPPPSWPESGSVEFKDVELAYRPGLPTVLRGVSFKVKPREKVYSAPGILRCIDHSYGGGIGRHRRENRGWQEFSAPGAL